MPWALLKASCSANAALPHHTLQSPDTALRYGLWALLSHIAEDQYQQDSVQQCCGYFLEEVVISLFILETGQNELSQTVRANILKFLAIIQAC